MQDTYKNGHLVRAHRLRNIHGLGVAALGLIGLAMAPAAVAQSYTVNTLTTFNGANGSLPEGSLLLSGNNLYGTAKEGQYDEVFSVPTTGGPPTILASFNGTNGLGLNGGLILSGNTLYGTASSGGPAFSSASDPNAADGVVFSVPITGGTPTVLASFNGTNGGSPSGLILSGSTLYGIAASGFGSDGEVFSVPTTGGTPTVLATFNGANGEGPSGLILSGSTLYGTTGGGGANSGPLYSNCYGTVFSVPIAGGVPTVLASFNGADGAVPNGNLVLIGSSLYGTTGAGGPSLSTDFAGYGTLFSVPITGGTPNVLTYFSSTNRGSASGGLVLRGSTFFGVSSGGGPGGIGFVFSEPITGGTITILASFGLASPYGYDLAGGPTLSGNTIYGVAQLGGIDASTGDYNSGTVFSLTPDSTPVPEASSVVSLGLLLALGLGGMVIATKRAKTQGKTQP